MKISKSKVFKNAIAMASMFALATGCATPPSQAQAKTFKIGILQIVEHDALDAARNGFVDGLAEAGYVDKQNIVIDYQNAQGDQSNLSMMSQRLVSNKSDLILAIATPSAQSLANATKEIPILVTAVTDPKDAKLVESNEKPNTNVSGTSDLTPVDKQLALMMKVLPNTKTIGILYNSSESNSEFQVNLVKAEAEKLGLKVETASIAAVSDIPQVTQSLISKIDALYLPTDNAIASSMPVVIKTTDAAKIPVIVAEEGMLNGGALLTEGLSYYNLGKQTAAMAVKVLKGEAKPQTMPIEYLKKTNIVINLASAKRLGITIPDDVLKSASSTVEQ